MITKTVTAVLLALLTAPITLATGFDKWFSDTTVRLDLTFCGDTARSVIAIDGMTRSDGWYGRRTNLDAVPVKGDASITMLDRKSGTPIYRQSFSSLYQEWLTTDEAAHTTQSFENCILVPMPYNEAEIIIELYDPAGRTTARNSFTIDPSDILIRQSVSRPIEHRYIHRSGDSKDKIDVAIIAEGYTDAEAELFYADASAAVESILGHEPFKTMADRFNFVAVAAASADSGVSVPADGLWLSTACSSNFSTFYSDRYLTTRHVGQVHDLLAGIPYEHIIILANTGVYGGGGIYNAYTLTTAHHPDFAPVVVHEFGHSFGALGDEYAYDGPDIIIVPEDVAYEPWQQNITSLVDFGAKWADMTGTDGIGVYRGANYSTTSFYRPAETCRMRDNDADGFCAVCRRAISRMIEFSGAPHAGSEEKLAE